MKTFIKTFAIFLLFINQNSVFAQYTTTNNFEKTPELIEFKKIISIQSTIVPMGFTTARYLEDEASLAAYFSTELNYPELAFDYGVEGVVVIGFQVNTDGNLTDLRIEKSLGFGCDKAALKAINNMPNWIPAQQDSRKMATRVLLPIEFELE